MAVKREKQKQLTLAQLDDKAVKIRCCYCAKKNICLKRVVKEQYEKKGITTLCAITPERPRSYKKKHGQDSKVQG